ncbi:MAG: C4-dicarboxylate ABC transporter permease [Kordiimonas sp.]|nr:C4-dicarboxylate ABC transporter permease [Kordiimonas sp.]
MLAIARFAKLIDRGNDYLGRLVSWLTLGLVILQFGIVLMHYVFHIGSVLLQESLLYLHSMIFLMGAGYTLFHNGHVRVDVIYGNLSARTKAWIDLLGTLLFLLPVTILISWMAYPYVVDSWAILEGSMESSGLQAVYLLKTIILIFTASLFLQGLSLIFHCLCELTGTTHMPEEPAQNIL